MDTKRPADLFRERGITQRQIADVVGRSQGAVSQWRAVPAEYVLRIEAAFPVLSRHELRPDIYPMEAA